MAPDSGVIRELYVDEQTAALGDRLRDRAAHDDEAVAHQVEVGRRRRRSRRASSRGRNTHPGRPF